MTILKIPLIWMLVCLLHLVPDSTTSASTDASSPRSNWGPSWAASAAQGTVVAVSCSWKSHDDNNNSQGIIILMRYAVSRRSPTKARQSEHEVVNKDDKLLVDGLQVTPFRSEAISISDSSKRWTLLGPNTLSCMTGLVSDVDHLTLLLQKNVDTHRLIYEGTHDYSPLQVAQLLAGHLQEAAKWDGGRPFGVQALLVGRQRSDWTLLTLDPSGGYRSWGRATAIGRTAFSVRKHLHQQLRDREEVSPESALHMAINATREALRETTSSPLDANDYEALLIWNTDTGLCVGKIEAADIDRAKKQVLEL